MNGGEQASIRSDLIYTLVAQDLHTYTLCNDEKWFKVTLLSAYMTQMMLGIILMRTYILLKSAEKSLSCTHFRILRRCNMHAFCIIYSANSGRKSLQKSARPP